MAGRIDRGLKQDTTEAGVPAEIASELVDIFGWDLDVGANLAPGDEFRIIYENTVGGREGDARRPARSSAPRS